MIENKAFFKGREIMPPKGWSDEGKENDKRHIEKERLYTKGVRGKYEKGLRQLAKKANNFSFQELLISEDQERPGVFPHFPNILTIPEGYVTNYGLIQEFVPENRLEEGLNALFYHERLHSIGDAVKHKNDIGVKFKKEQGELKEKINNLIARKNVHLNIKESLLLEIEEQQLNGEAGLMLGKISDYDKKEEIIVNRQLMKETPSVDALASLMLLDYMLSDGIVGARVVLNPVRKFQKNDLSSARLTEEFIKHAGKIYPHAHRKTLENLMNSYIKIGGEILERFDAWEKGNKRRKIVTPGVDLS